MSSPEEKKQLNILLVDQTGQIMEFLETLRNSDRCCVDQVESTEDAVSRLEEEVYDIIIADGTIPGKRGIKLLKKAQYVQPEATAVLVTPGIDKEAEKEARETGFEYCPKLFMLEEMMF